MKQTSIRDLKHETRKILERVKAGETLEITCNKHPVAVLSPVLKPAMPRPDFAARLREIYGDKVLEVTGAEVVSELRGDR